MNLDKGEQERSWKIVMLGRHSIAEEQEPRGMLTNISQSGKLGFTPGGVRKPSMSADYESLLPRKSPQTICAWKVDRRAGES